jgi:hypothetical protein
MLRCAAREVIGAPSLLNSLRDVSSMRICPQGAREVDVLKLELWACHLKCVACPDFLSRLNSFPPGTACNDHASVAVCFAVHAPLDQWDPRYWRKNVVLIFPTSPIQHWRKLPHNCCGCVADGSLRNCADLVLDKQLDHRRDLFNVSVRSPSGSSRLSSGVPCLIGSVAAN